jgi:hypothetical protein
VVEPLLEKVSLGVLEGDPVSVLDPEAVFDGVPVSEADGDPVGDGVGGGVMVSESVSLAVLEADQLGVIVLVEVCEFEDDAVVVAVFVGVEDSLNESESERV